MSFKWLWAAATAAVVTLVGFAGGESDFYSLRSTTSSGETLYFSSLRGKVVLVTNVASLCGYTDSEYKALVDLHDRLKGTGKFEVLAYPCNQFGEQEPWTVDKVEDHVKNTYGVNFRVMKKINVRGDNVEPVFRYLTEKTGVPPTWNFQKYLINHAGDDFRPFPTGGDFRDLERAAEEYLAAAAKEDGKDEL